MPGIKFQLELEDTMSNRWLTALTVDPEVTGVSVHEIIARLGEDNIEARPVWKPMHLQPLFEGVKYYPHEDGNSVSDYLFAYGLCLPSGSNMSVEERVIGLIEGLLNK